MRNHLPDLLKGLKIRIKDLNREFQARAVSMKKEILSHIDHIDHLEGQNNIQNQQIEDRKKYKVEQLELIIKE